jgi:polysaccharide deacetylase 2 family uncharacterized protein YibQ
LASLAIPRIALPAPPALPLKAMLARPAVRLGAAGVALAVAGAVLFSMARSSEHDANTVKLPLASAFRHAPPGWRDSLPTQSSSFHVTQDVIRLSARPLAPLAGATWNRPIAALPPFRPGQPLPPAPFSGFFAPGPTGLLPIIAPDGRTPFEAYRRPFIANGRPKVALIVGGLGLNTRLTQQAIETLPPEITLAFSPYAEGLQGWIDMARAHGHEALLEAPMEPIDYPENDSGAYTLLANGQPPENVKKLEGVMSRATGYFGLTNYLGSRFLTSDGGYQSFAAALRGRGLAFVDDGTASLQRDGGVARASAERVIDDQLTSGAIDQQLLALEAGALQRGSALGAGFAYPVTLEKVAQWSRSLDQRGFQLAPASALTRPQ